MKYLLMAAALMTLSGQAEISREWRYANKSCSGKPQEIVIEGRRSNGKPQTRVSIISINDGAQKQYFIEGYPFDVIFDGDRTHFKIDENDDGLPDYMYEILCHGEDTFLALDRLPKLESQKKKANK